MASKTQDPDRAYILVVDARGRILCAKNSSGSWVLPGGRRKPTETLHAAASREAREELSARAHLREVLCLTEKSRPGRRPTLEIVYRASLSRRPRPSREMVRLRWLAPTEALSRLKRRSHRLAVKTFISSQHPSSSAPSTKVSPPRRLIEATGGRRPSSG